MAAASLLVLLAAVGVDYGWQPDGTQSARGDNIEYIIQVPPDQLDDIRRAGEVTSTLDPAIAGRVVRVVFRIGTESLPRDAGHAVAVAPANPLPADPLDHASLPIPQFGDADSIPVAALGEGGSASQSLMKPDPQSEGFTLPPSVRATVGTNPSVSTDPVTTERDNRWSDIRGQAGTTSSTAPAASTPATARTSSAGPSTDPVASATGWPAAPAAAGSATAIDASAGGSSWANQTAPPATFSNTPLTPPALQNPPAAATGVASQGGGIRRPTDPSDPSWSGYGTTPTFGTPPAGLPTSPPSATGLAATANSPVSPADPARSGTFAATGVGGGATNSTQDALGNLYDRLGRPIDSQGRLIDPGSGQLIDASGHWIDQYGRRIDRFGRPLPGEGSGVSPPTSVATLQPPPLPSQAATTGYPQGGYSQPNYVPPTTAHGMPPATSNVWGAIDQDRSPYYSDPRVPYPALQSTPGQAFPGGDYPQSATSGLAQAGSGRGLSGRQGYPTTGWSSEREPLSASDQASLNADARQERALTTPPVEAIKPKKVAAQPFFNFILLISLVGNAYLVFETGNLRRKFRNMIANVRASKVSTQPAN